MIVLAIESSCDETATAVIDNGKVLSDLVASQDEIHGRFGGVVPELAARAHMERIGPMVREALDRAAIRMDDLDAVAVTAGPGLVVCLLVAISVAKGIAFGRGIELVGVNHLDGHLSAIFADPEQEDPSFPYVGMIVSGGHTSLYKVSGPGKYEQLGQTLDDAAGEAFDKCAKVLDLPYPGGREVEKLASLGDESAVDFPRPLMNREGFDFSFSGLKTAVINYWERCGRNESEKANIAASFQKAAVDVLVGKSMKAAGQAGASELVVSGGVAANGRLRREFLAEGERRGVRVRFPSMRLCTDNAVMIAAAGQRMLSEGKSDGYDLTPRAVWPL